MLSQTNVIKLADQACRSHVRAPRLHTEGEQSQRMSETAVIAGVGPGLGESLVRRFAQEGYSVGMFARSADYLLELGL